MLTGDGGNVIIVFCRGLPPRAAGVNSPAPSSHQNDLIDGGKGTNTLDGGASSSTLTNGANLSATTGDVTFDPGKGDATINGGTGPVTHVGNDAGIVDHSTSAAIGGFGNL